MRARARNGPGAINWSLPGRRKPCKRRDVAPTHVHHATNCVHHSSIYDGLEPCRIKW